MSLFCPKMIKFGIHKMLGKHCKDKMTQIHRLCHKKLYHNKSIMFSIKKRNNIFNFNKSRLIFGFNSIKSFNSTLNNGINGYNGHSNGHSNGYINGNINGESLRNNINGRNGRKYTRYPGRVILDNDPEIPQRTRLMITVYDYPGALEDILRIFRYVLSNYFAL